MSDSKKLSPMQQLVLNRHRVNMGQEKASCIYLNRYEAVLDYQEIPVKHRWICAVEIADEKRKEENELRALAACLYEEFDQEKAKHHA
ncbi:MAG: hypothetical protein WCT49_02415 [Candidatus Paceibacterota bacterium]|jgi:hypothetical protein|nr:hypothetical protein [Candidatus Paceibacterota bacterium]